MIKGEATLNEQPIIVYFFRLSFWSHGNVISAYGCKESTKNTVAKTKNPRARKNFNNCIENK